MDYLKGPGPLEGHRRPDYRDELPGRDRLDSTHRIARGILGGAGQRSIQPTSLQGRVSTQPPSRLAGLTKSGGLGAIRKEEAHALSRLINDADDALLHLIQELEKAASPPNPTISKKEEVKVKVNQEIIETQNPEKTKRDDVKKKIDDSI